MYRQYDKNKLENIDMCRECGGICCKTTGCSYFPEDFKFDLNFENLKSEIDKGFIAIDYISFTGEKFPIALKEPIYYLRVKNIGENSPIGIRNSKTCIKLKENGCEFDFSERPSGGKYVVPFRGECGCYNLYTFQEFIDLWKPYQELLKLLIKCYS